jgi:hypothetical protein
MSSRPTTSTYEDDTDATSRLPTIEPVPGATDSDDAAQITDVLPQPAVPAGTSELAERLREVERRLDRKDERVRELEALLEQAAERQQSIETELAEARARQAELQAQLEEARAHAQTQSQLLVERKTVAVRYREQDFTELRNRTERQLEALTSWQGFRAISDAQLDEAEARNAMLESKVSSLQASLHALEGGQARSRPQSQSEALKSELNDLQSQIATLRAELAVARQAQQQTESRPAARITRTHDRWAPDSTDAPVSATVVMYGDRWEYKEEPDDSPTGEQEVAPQPATEAPIRALVLQGGGGDRIYPVGRRTTIGRTPDNDVHIDAPSVSRHHAVLLVSGENCRIEDLDSTNGVMVNGQRVIRHELEDGDTLTIGKIEFRFLQRL